jgi:ADP-dependent NAD(P)H-hydrate dehydratase / NAD(P)H-hydrate epimerase
MTENASVQIITIDDAKAMPWPTDITHKHSRGRLAVVAGGPLQTGAARLAARGGQRIGAGWVTLFGACAACEIMAHHETSILVCERDMQIPISQQLKGFDTVVVGPAFGLAPECGAQVADLIKYFCGALVLDADSLTHISRAKDLLFEALKSRSNPAVLTPHSGEFTALFGEFDVKDKVLATCRAARTSGSVIVHKGASTIIADPNGGVFKSDVAPPFLASAGTGDVLAGMIGGLMAQGMIGMEAAKAAVWLHSEAAWRVGVGLIASDLIVKLADVLDDIAPDHLKRRVRKI